MRLPRLSVNKPVTTAMIFMAVLLFGMVSWQMLPRDMLPEIEIPTLTVVTVYPGASAEEVEEQVTNELEKTLSGTEELKRITSSSRENVSLISLEFKWGTNIAQAANSARDLMELVKSDLPDDANPPYIMKVNSAMIPVVVYSITAEESYPGLEKIVEENIINHLKKIDGVGTAFMIGQPTREIKIQVHPADLKAYNLSIQQISTILEAENMSIPGGNIKPGKHDFSLRIPGDINSLEELKSIALTSFNNRIIRLKDVADIKDEFKDKNEYVYSYQKKGVGLFVQKQTGTNTLEIFKAVEAKMDEIEPNLPSDVSYNRVFDTSEVITEVNNNLGNTIWYAGIFVMIVVLAFLRQWRNSLIVILTIPFSLIAAFITMFVMDYSINIFSLMSLIVAIGMVVDNAIVVLENIDHHLDLGSPAKEAAVFGTREMGTAITASTLTTISVFLPLLFIGGLVGILFKQLAMLVAITMLASLVTSLSLTPMLASRLRKRSQKHRKHGWLYNTSENVFIALEKAYHSVLKLAVKRAWIIIAIAVILLASAGFLATRQGSDYIPEIDAGDVITVIETEVGTSTEETKRIAKKVENIYFEKVPEMVSQYTIVGQTETNLLTSIGFAEGKNKATISAHLSLPETRDRSAEDIAKMIREKLADMPEIVNYQVIGGSMMQKMLLGSTKPIEYKILGSDYDFLNQTAGRLAEKMKANPNFSDIETTIDKGKMEYQVIVNKDKASRLGLNTAMIGMQVRQSIYGKEGGQFRQQGDKFDIMIRYAPSERKTVDDIKNISLTTLTGQHVPLSAVADIKTGTGPLEIMHETQQRIVRVGANLNGISLGEGTQIAKGMLAETGTPPGVSVELGGNVTEKDESFANLNLVFLIAFALVYMIMASQFESFKAPFIIIFAIPFSLIGVVYAFALTGITLSVVSFVGIIMLLGIVVNNGIVLVDYTNLLRARGEFTRDAIINAGRSRLRPVLMTSFTTILAMIPMSLSKSMGHEIWVPLGITIIGGLLVSMLITLLVIPSLYALFYRRNIINEKTDKTQQP
ncbi:MAG: efflux RND transporter permease subunit [Bacteroidales bacterium]